jgi:RNA polymerase sigma-70 factor (ECF subfamily)
MEESHAPRCLPLEELIRVCADSADQENWEELIHRVHPVIAATIVRTASRFKEFSRSIADDLIQETYLRICANRFRLLREFHANEPEAIFGYLKTVAFNVAVDHFRKKSAAKRGAAAPEYPIDGYLENAVPAGEKGGLSVESMDRQILLAEIDRYLSESDVRPSERRIFWLYYRHGMTARAIAAIANIGLTQKGVESAIHRLTGLVRSWMVGLVNKPATSTTKCEGNSESNPTSV